MGFGTPSGSLNVLKALDVTLRDGIDHISGKRLGLPTGDLKDFKTFDDFFSAFKMQLAFFIEILADHEELEYLESGKQAPYLYLSMLYDDCIRITSYNVCYTKLLRVSSSGLVTAVSQGVTTIKATAQDGGIYSESEVQVLLVITSYSIHYTKLYDMYGRLCPQLQ